MPLLLYFDWPTFSIPNCAGNYVVTLQNVNSNFPTELFTLSNDPTNPYFSAIPDAVDPWVINSPLHFII